MTAVQSLSTGHPFSAFLKGRESHDSPPLPLARALPTTLNPGNPTRNKGHRNHLRGSNSCHAAPSPPPEFPGSTSPDGKSRGCVMIDDKKPYLPQTSIRVSCSLNSRAPTGAPRPSVRGAVPASVSAPRRRWPSQHRSCQQYQVNTRGKGAAAPQADQLSSPLPLSVSRKDRR